MHLNLETLFIWKPFVITIEHKSLKCVVINMILLVLKVDGQILSKTFFSIHYRKGLTNSIVEALTCIHEVNMFIFTKLKSDNFDQLQGKCLHDSFFKRYRMRGESGKDAINRKIIFQCHDMPKFGHLGIQ